MKILYQQKVHFFLWALLLTILGNGCCSAGNATLTAVKQMSMTKLKDSSRVTTDSLINKVVGDSIEEILNNSRRIKVELIKEESDTVIVLDTKYLKQFDRNVFCFLILNPANYLSNGKVYGIMMPSIRVTEFYKGKKVIMLFDFELMKWSLCNENNEEIARFDLSNNELHRWAVRVFPEDTFLKSTLKIKTIKK